MKMVEQIASDIKNMYLPKNRYANFGDVLLTMEVHGIRGMSASIDFDFPITVIIGKNGSGKSTLAQLALCCYRYKLSEEVVHNSRNYYSLGSFLLNPVWTQNLTHQMPICDILLQTTQKRKKLDK